MTFLDVDGHRITAFITDTPAGVVPGQLAGLDLRHRQHARVEDRIRQAKATGMRNFPCHHYAANSAWLEIVMTAMDLSLPGPNSSASPTNRTSPPARSRRSGTGCCTSRPGSATAPGKPDSGSTRPGGGPSRSPAAGTGSVPRSPNPGHPSSPRSETLTPASGTGADPTRQSGPQPTLGVEALTPQHISTTSSRHSRLRERSRLTTSRA